MTSKPNIDSIFCRAVEIASDSERLRYVEQACGTDAGLCARVEKLLKAHLRAGSFMQEEEQRTLEASNERPGCHIGPYKLRERLGEGGMGVVWAAEQKMPLRRRVALKLIKPGMDSEKVIARFEAEREALALMDHPNIARVLDAGTTPEGRPYFVMELIPGVPITDYCNRHKLTVRERLQLYVGVCRAIQHAHQKGIIHRDIKPTNVLVTEQDAVPIPKVIDFGVAKALHHSLGDLSVYTGIFQAVGTLAYMSPEQAALSITDVDTRADVYGLGALLYELLTGSPPFDRRQLESAAIDEACRIIREQDPPKPSTRISSLPSKVSIAARDRESDPTNLSRVVRGELDWIVMKALEKDRNRRYETASALALDIGHYLQNEPVSASPPKALYRARKFARRYRVLLATGFLVAISLFVGLTGTTIGFLDAVSQRKMAEQASGEAQRFAEVAVSRRNTAEAERDARRLEQYISDMNLAMQAWEANNLSRLDEILHWHIPLEGEADLRGFEWRYLRQLSEYGLSQKSWPLPYVGGHVSFLADGKQMVVSLCDNTVVVFDIDFRPDGISLTERQRIGEAYKHIWMMPDDRALPNGQQIVRRADSTDRLSIVDLSTGSERFFEPFNTSVACVAVTPDQRVVASGSGGGELRICDLTTGQTLMEQELDAPGHESGMGTETGRPVLSLTSSPDATAIVGTVANGVVIKWKISAGVAEETGRVNVGVACWESRFSPDGSRLLLGCEDGTLKILDADTFEELNRIPAHQGALRSIDLSPQGDQLATGSRDGLIRLWKWPSCELIADLKGHSSGIVSICYHPSHPYLISAGGDATVKFWSLRQVDAADEIKLPQGLPTLLRSEQSSEFIIGLRDRVIHWDPMNGHKPHSIPELKQPLTGMVIASDGTAISTDGTGHLYRHHTRMNRLDPLVTIGASEEPLACSSDGTLIVVGQRGGGASLWNLSKNEKVADLPVQLVNFHVSKSAAAFSPDDRFLALASADYTIHIYDVATCKCIKKLEGHGGGVISLSFSPCDADLLASAAFDNTARIWSISRGEALQTLNHSIWVGAAVFSPDGARLATAGGDATVKLWMVNRGRQTMSINTGVFHPRGLQFARWFVSSIGERHIRSRLSYQSPGLSTPRESCRAPFLPFFRHWDQDTQPAERFYDVRQP